MAFRGKRNLASARENRRTGRREAMDAELAPSTISRTAVAAANALRGALYAVFKMRKRGAAKADFRATLPKHPPNPLANAPTAPKLTI